MWFGLIFQAQRFPLQQATAGSQATKAFSGMIETARRPQVPDEGSQVHMIFTVIIKALFHSLGLHCGLVSGEEQCMNGHCASWPRWT